MAEVVAALSGCWKLVTTIREVVDRIEQTRDDARALHFLKQKATWFLERLNHGLVGRDTSAYISIVQSLESLLRDILQATTEYMTKSKISQLLNASQTRRQLLDLNERLRFFVDAYLIETTLDDRNPQLNFEALSHPPSVTGRVKLPDEVEWEIMSQLDERVYGSPSRILSWQRGIADPSEEEMKETNTIITTPPPRIPGMEMHSISSPNPASVAKPQLNITDNPVDRWNCCRASEDTHRRYTDCRRAYQGCCHENGCWRFLLCLPFTLPVCLLDCGVEIFCFCYYERNYSCTRFLLHHFPLCRLDFCLRGGNFDCKCARSE